MLAPSTLLKLEDFHVSSTHGFLPSEAPLERLPRYYERWEEISSHLPILIQNYELADVVAALPILSTEFLMSEPEWRRACVLLGFLANGFLRGQRKAVDHLPANISVPYMAVSDHLGLPPVPTVAAQNLWNYRLLNHERSTGDPENLSAIQTFTGTEDESWFYIMVTAIEARGAPIITIALHAFDAASTDNPENVITCLNKMSALLLSLSELLLRMYERCNPSYFYHHVRPFLAGSKSAEIPDGIFYEDGSGGGSYPQYNGPSAAQSSLWQFIDIAFGVTHWPTGTCCKSSDTANDSFIPSGRDAGFIEEMRLYMPGPHRLFLRRVSEIANIRRYVVSHPLNIALSTAYNQCLERIVGFRTKHIQLVSRYIVVQSRSSQSIPSPTTLGGTIIQPSTNERVISKITPSPKGALGTGGTSPIEFLKQVRNETQESSVRA